MVSRGIWVNQRSLYQILCLPNLVINCSSINDSDLFFYSPTTMLFDKRMTWFFGLHCHKSVSQDKVQRAVSLRWYAFLCGFASDAPFTTDYFRSTSFFSENAHHDWLTKENISKWFPVWLKQNTLLWSKGQYFCWLWSSEVNRSILWKCSILRLPNLHRKTFI